MRSGASTTMSGTTDAHVNGAMNTPARSSRPRRSGSAAAGGPYKTSIWSDATRLAALLHDAQTNVTVPAATWSTIGNEADVLANRIYARSAGHAAARALAGNVRTNIRSLRTAATSGDAANARSSAAAALPYVTQLIDWSAPPKPTT